MFHFSHGSPLNRERNPQLVLKEKKDVIMIDEFPEYIQQKLYSVGLNEESQLEHKDSIIGEEYVDHLYQILGTDDLITLHYWRDGKYGSWKCSAKIETGHFASTGK